MLNFPLQKKLEPVALRDRQVVTWLACAEFSFAEKIGASCFARSTSGHLIRLFSLGFVTGHYSINVDFIQFRKNRSPCNRKANRTSVHDTWCSFEYEISLSF